MKKTIQLFTLLLLVSSSINAQTLTGLWTGTLTNDSNTIRKDQELEIILTQYKDKVYGYSRMTFIVHDTLYYIVKRVKGTIENDVCEVIDDEIVTHNFPRKPDKGVKLVSTFRRNREDSIWRLDGDWKTTESKKQRYYSISGKLSLNSQPDLDKAKIFPHLEELKMTGDIAFYQEYKQAEESAVAAKLAESTAKNRELAVQKKTQPSAVKVTSTPELQKAPVSAEPLIKPSVTATVELPEEKEKQLIATNTQKPVSETQNTIASQASVNNSSSIVVSKPAPPVTTVSPPVTKTSVPVSSVSPPVTRVAEPETAATKKEPVKVPTRTAPVTVAKKENPPANNSVASTTAKVPVVEKPAINSVAKEVVKEKAKEPDVVPSTVAANEPKPVLRQTESVPTVRAPERITGRTLATPQTVFFKSDSLQLSLYDNGEVDGDTVSVLLNGQLMWEKQGLKTSAIRKTIYVPAGQTDSLTLILFAENLGKYPPNTGLLVVHDGEDVYQVRFSADLRQNAAIIFKRRKN